MLGAPSGRVRRAPHGAAAWGEPGSNLGTMCLTARAVLGSPRSQKALGGFLAEPRSRLSWLNGFVIGCGSGEGCSRSSPRCAAADVAVAVFRCRTLLCLGLGFEACDVIRGRVGRERPELVVGLVGAVGSPLGEATAAIQAALGRYAYKNHVIRLSEFLINSPGPAIDSSNEFELLKTSMKSGTWLREETGRGDAVLALAVAQMAKVRKEASDESVAPDEIPPALDNHCFILRSLKHPHEVSRLRALYRDQFFLIGVYSSRSHRLEALADRLAHSVGGRAEGQRANAEVLMATDAAEAGTRLGQSVSDTFALSDAFVTSEQLRRDVDRLFDLVFGAPYVTPTRDEQGMFFAQAAALRSAALSRQVGACITSRDGDVLAVGCNEVPKAGGGQYWPGDDPDGRDFNAGYDRNDRLKERVVRELVAELRAQGWIGANASNSPVDELVRAVMSKKPPPGIPRLRQTQLGSLTEFGRDVHAEMAALLTLARSPISSREAHLYTTTYPCHNCAKHILDAGIARVVYIEPYPKSFAGEFHSEAIAPEGTLKEGALGKLVMQPFAGVAPRKYLEWFMARGRKKDDGAIVDWPGANPQPRFVDPLYGGYDQARLDSEALFIKEVLAHIAQLAHTEQKDKGHG